MRTHHAAPLAVLLLATAVPQFTRAQGASPDDRLRALRTAVEGQFAQNPGHELYVQTDKPLYHPGETVWFRVWEVAVRSLSGTSGEHGVTVQLIDARGAKVAEKRVLNQAGLATNDFPLAASLPGGNYTLRVASDLGPKEERPIVVSAYEVPRLKKAVDFTRASYAPGDQVTALVSVERATGEPLTGARVTATLTLDGAQVASFVVAIDARGQGVVRFQVPTMRKSGLLLTLNADAGGIVETLQKRVPVVLDRIDVKVFPEGGDLVTGLASRVYLQARDDQGKPAEVSGQVVDDQGKSVATFSSLHDGMARFALTPQPGRSYSVKLARPGVPPTSLPDARPEGCVLRSQDDYTSRDPLLKATVACTGARRLTVGATLRERLLASSAIETTAAAAPVPVELALPAGSVGAVRLTVFDDAASPVAERLVYRGLGREMRVQIRADRKEYSPRDKVTLTVRTTDADQKPIAAEVALSVVDDAVLAYADSQTPHLLSEMYLLPEMPGQTLHEPNFYFSSSPKAPEALDLLLGTQGFRRFVWRWVKR